MEIIYCQKCHNKKRGMNYQVASQEIAEVFGDKAQVVDGCSSFCGPGAKVHFIEVDGEIIDGEDFPTLIKNIKQRKGE